MEMLDKPLTNGGASTFKSSNGNLPANEDPRLALFGYTDETIKMLLIPMFANK